MTTATKLPARISRRKQARDQRAERLARRLRRDYPALRDLPVTMVKSFAQLNLLAAGVAEKLKERGLIRPNGDPDGLIDVFRRLKLAELAFARQIGIGFGSLTEPAKPVLDLEAFRDEA